MRLREFDIDETAHIAAEQSTPPSIDAWLDVFERLLQLPGAQKSSIRDELRGHLEERVRDLMLRGADGETALQQAIGELGEAAELAERLRRAHRYPRRRLIMNTLLAGAGTIVVVASVAVMTNGGQPGPSSLSTDPAMYTAAVQDQHRADAKTLDEIDISVELDMTARDIVAAISETNEIGVSVDWGSISESGMEPDEPLGLSAEEISVLRVLNEINRRYDETWDALDWRLDGRMLIIDRQQVFDRQESKLVSYDIRATLQLMHVDHGISHDDAVSQVSGLIYEMVEPQQWDVNGGALAHLQIVGGKMFVHAPMRMQEKISWLLRELDDRPDAAAGDAGPNVMPQPTALDRGAHEQRQQAIAGLRKLGMAMTMWHDEQDAPLDHLQQVVTAGYLNPGDLRSPVGPAGDGRDYWVDFSFDPDVDEGVDWSKRLWAIDRALYEQSDSFLVLYADTHLEMINAQQLKDLMAHPANQGIAPDLPVRRAELEKLSAEVERMQVERELAKLQEALKQISEQRDVSMQLARSLTQELDVAQRTRDLAVQDARAIREELARVHDLLEEHGISKNDDAPAARENGS